MRQGGKFLDFLSRGVGKQCAQGAGMALEEYAQDAECAGGGAIKEPLVPFDATLVPQSLTGPVVTASPEPQVEADVVDSVPTGKVELPEVPALLQMIGRGTRLYAGKDKFYIFDWCNNFEYFSVHTEGASPVAVKSLTERLFSLRLDIAFSLQSAGHQEKEEDRRLHDELKETLHRQVESLSMARIDVSAKMDVATRGADAPAVRLQATYQQRVVDYLAEHTDLAVLRKIQNFEQLTSADINELQRIFWEELGTREEYNTMTQGKRYNQNVAAFIRVINGIDRQKALQIYAQFIKDSDLTAEQEQYLKNVLDYVSVNGDIQLGDFMEYPLKNVDWRVAFGNQFVNLKDFVKRIHQVITASA